MGLNVILGESTATIELADGKTKYVLSPLTLGDIGEAEDKFGCDLESFDKAVKKLKNILFLVYLSAKKRNSVTEKQIGEMFGVADLPNLTKIVEQIFSISGLSPDKVEQAEKKE